MVCAYAVFNPRPSNILTKAVETALRTLRRKVKKPMKKYLLGWLRQALEKKSLASQWIKGKRHCFDLNIRDAIFSTKARLKLRNKTLPSLALTAHLLGVH
jgi:hypothetical protein